MSPGLRESVSPGEGYFNDLSRQPPPPTRRDSPPEQEDGPDEARRNSQQDEGANGQVPKPKRIACILCRKRKLRCNGNKPSCGTCLRLQHECSYDEVRRKSGPKRGYVKALEARLAQVETLLKKQDDQPPQQNSSEAGGIGQTVTPDFGIDNDNLDIMQQIEATISDQSNSFAQNLLPEGVPFPWEMIGLGLDEPLPTPEVVEELTSFYFDKIHPTAPMIHRPRFYAAMSLAPHLRPPVCLRYAMWCNAAMASDKYTELHEHFYMRARKYIQQDEMKGHGEGMITIAHCQTWCLLATYEFKQMYFPRAWMSSGRASRMAHMMGLHRTDGKGLDVKQCLPPARDWTEKEERRRTFWLCFCIDRYSSIGTGWPMAIDEKDITSDLPVTDMAYELNKPSPATTLREVLTMGGIRELSGFGGVVLTAYLFGRNLLHLHRPEAKEREDDLLSGFWKRHREIDDIISNISLSMPDSMRLPDGINDPNVVFMNMSIHTSTICLHQAAIFKADENKMPPHVSAESKVRCITAAAQVATIMRQVSHLDLSTMNPFVSFSLYVSARVFVQYLKSRPTDTQRKSALQFLLSAMYAIKRKTPLTESFLVQLDVDLEAAGLENTHLMRAAASQSTNSAAYEFAKSLHASGDCNELRPPAYGDLGDYKYNDSQIPPTIVSDQQDTSPYASLKTATAGDNANLPYISSTFDLPHRTPGSHPGSSADRMDLSPEGSGISNDTHTPQSGSQQNLSSHTSSTGYSPVAMHQQQLYGQPQNGEQMPGIATTLASNGGAGADVLDAAIFNVNDSATFGNYNVNAAFSGTNTSGFSSIPPNWNGVGQLNMASTSTGFTPDASGMINELSGMTEAEWNQILDMENVQGWDTGLVHDQHVLLQERMRQLSRR